MARGGPRRASQPPPASAAMRALLLALLCDRVIAGYRPYPPPVARGDGSNCTLHPPGVGLGTGSLGIAHATTIGACCTACTARSDCVAFTFEIPGKCFLKGNDEPSHCSQKTCVSGTNGRSPTPQPGPPPPHPPHPSPSPAPPSPPAPPAPELLKDLATLRQRFFGFYLDFGDCTQTQFCMQGSYMLYQDGTKGSCASTCDDSESFTQTMTANGTWDDVDYADETHAKWKPMLHPDRLLSMIRSYHCGFCSRLVGKADVLAKVHRGLRWWLDTHPKPSQWWWADIGQVRDSASGGPCLAASLSATHAADPPRARAAIQHTRPTGVVLLLPGVTCVLLCVCLGTILRSAPLARGEMRALIGSPCLGVCTHCDPTRTWAGGGRACSPTWSVRS
jgi:hypothetical protein